MFEAIFCRPIVREGKLRIESSKVEQDIGEFETDVVLGYWAVGMVAYCWPPCKVDAELKWEFATLPRQSVLSIPCCVSPYHIS